MPTTREHHAASPQDRRMQDGGSTTASLRHLAGLVGAAGAVGAVAGGLGRQALGVLAGLPRPWHATGTWTVTGAARVEDLVGLGAMLVGTVVAAWFCLGLLVAAACTAARVTGRAWDAGERLVERAAPPLVRRALALSLGTGVALAGAGLPAVAAVAPPDDLGWAVTSTGEGPASRQVPGVTPGHVADAGTTASGVPTAAVTGPVPPATTGSGTPSRRSHEVAAPGAEVAARAPVVPAVTVRPGDTLWDIARSHLPADASTAQVAAAWPTWYAANLDVVGDDPDLIRPGQRLVPPAAAAAAETPPPPADAVAGPAPATSTTDRADR